ncbi:unnamed protein product [Owenia fusiformis]|uniref:Uncharacterized protein n=1 Tax=Owenia fusiformis TaxID=6347 RepID=A0A8S4NZP6_OWEFU|nr:unnamed protein product [Owenia fusiformis]
MRVLSTGSSPRTYTIVSSNLGEHSLFDKNHRGRRSAELKVSPLRRSPGSPLLVRSGSPLLVRSSSCSPSMVKSSPQMVAQHSSSSPKIIFSPKPSNLQYGMKTPPHQGTNRNVTPPHMIRCIKTPESHSYQTEESVFPKPCPMQDNVKFGSINDDLNANNQPHSNGPFVFASSPYPLAKAASLNTSLDGGYMASKLQYLKHVLPPLPPKPKFEFEHLSRGIMTEDAIDTANMKQPFLHSPPIRNLNRKISPKRKTCMTQDGTFNRSKAKRCKSVDSWNIKKKHEQFKDTNKRDVAQNERRVNGKHVRALSDTGVFTKSVDVLTDAVERDMNAALKAPKENKNISALETFNDEGNVKVCSNSKSDDAKNGAMEKDLHNLNDALTEPGEQASGSNDALKDHEEQSKENNNYKGNIEDGIRDIQKTVQEKPKWFQEFEEAHKATDSDFLYYDDQTKQTKQKKTRRRLLQVTTRGIDHTEGHNLLKQYSSVAANGVYTKLDTNIDSPIRNTSPQCYNVGSPVAKSSIDDGNDKIESRNEKAKSSKSKVELSLIEMGIDEVGHVMSKFELAVNEEAEKYSSRADDEHIEANEEYEVVPVTYLEDIDVGLAHVKSGDSVCTVVEGMDDSTDTSDIIDTANNDAEDANGMIDIANNDKEDANGIIDVANNDKEDANDIIDIANNDKEDANGIIDIANNDKEDAIDTIDIANNDEDANDITQGEGLCHTYVQASNKSHISDVWKVKSPQTKDFSYVPDNYSEISPNIINSQSTSRHPCTSTINTCLVKPMSKFPISQLPVTPEANLIKKWRPHSHSNNCHNGSHLKDAIPCIVAMSVPSIFNVSNHIAEMFVVSCYVIILLHLLICFVTSRVLLDLQIDGWEHIVFLTKDFLHSHVDTCWLLGRC